MSPELRRIGEKARSDPRLVFTSLYHHICDVDHLRACFEALPADRAVGIDGISKEQYGANLDENLKELSSRLRNMGYRPQPKRRTHIPKPGSVKGRPLAISCFEDKLVELAIKRVLEPIYEVQFEDSSYGYRPGRSQHQCLDDLGRTIQQSRINHIVEADIRSFFNTVDHPWMLKFLGHRIGDPRIIRLIGRLLKGGILEDGLVQASEEGTPQGSILTPPTKLRTPAYNGVYGSREPVSRGAIRGRCKPRSGWSLTSPRRGRLSDEASTAAVVGAHRL